MCVSGANLASRLPRKVDGHRHSGPRPPSVGYSGNMARKPAGSLSTLQEIQVRRERGEGEGERELIISMWLILYLQS